MAEVGEKEFTKLLGQSYGYGIVVGIGVQTDARSVGLTWVQAKFTQMNPNAASEFATASRSIKAGLICCGITSAWTWSATLLQSSTATYQSGVSASWWYGVGGTIQIAFFAMIAAKVKMNANGATTFLQIVKTRFGVPCHLLFTFYAFVCVHVVCGSLVLGASATVNALTGMSVNACNFLLPIGIAVYVIAGGLRATFICDFIHTVILFVIIYIFVFTAYGTSDVLGSPGCNHASSIRNTGGSYVTMRSNAGVVFAGCTIAAGFSGVFCDQGYWQRAIASRPESTTKAYMLGALSWFAIPWGFGTVMGLGARALSTNPEFPTYPYALSAAQQSAGLVAPAAAVTMLGKGGAATILHQVGIGVALTPAVVPIGLTVCWNRLSKHAAFWGTLFGTVCGMLGWMIGCWKIYGSINVTNLGQPCCDFPFNLNLLCPRCSLTVCRDQWCGARFGYVDNRHFLLAWIYNYDWQGTRAISNAGAPESETRKREGNEKDTVEVVTENAALDRDELQRVFKRATWISLLLAFIITILIPMPMFGESYVFSRKFFTGGLLWYSIIWLLMAGSFCILLPIWESRTEIHLIISGLTGKMRKKNSSSV
ncbi:hypothetical protein CPB85DRAFT_1375220 [Mucidula mucida]|nr:hypothetical protein CPB85DRAFT_1375220 [Mucidula mucida]